MTVQAHHLEEVLADKGAKFLETYRVPTLTWEEVKALKGPGLVGLGAPGGEPIGRRFGHFSSGALGPSGCHIVCGSCTCLCCNQTASCDALSMPSD